VVSEAQGYIGRILSRVMRNASGLEDTEVLVTGFDRSLPLYLKRISLMKKFPPAREHRARNNILEARSELELFRRSR
jgi:hypothetical protein